MRKIIQRLTYLHQSANVMKDTYLLPDQINHGFRLAYFILCDKELAFNITQDAMAELKIQLHYQEKRSYYKPQGVPYKVVWDKASLFQLLVLRISEKYEKNQESLCDTSNRTLSEEDLIVRYVKCLLFEIMSRNSFYATVGICKLLYNYSPRETDAIYTWLLPDFKDYAAFRRAKIRIKSRLSKRFKGLIEENARLTIKLSTIQEFNWKSQLVENALELFKPTAISCPPPDFFNEYYIWEEQLTQNKAVVPDHLEQIRIHVVVCPSCFKMLNTALGHRPPYERLALPKFFISHGEGKRAKCDASNLNLPNLTSIDIYRILVNKI